MPQDQQVGTAVWSLPVFSALPCPENRKGIVIVMIKILREVGL